MSPELIKPHLLSQGKWDDNISWEFFVDDTEPQLALCTAVCCFVFIGNSLLLVENKRGWELPAGHIEDGESLTEAVEREVFEEANTKITPPILFGYKKLTAKKKVLRRDGIGYYPFPTAYIPFYLAKGVEIKQKDFSPDITGSLLVSTEQAVTILSAAGQYLGIIEYLTGLDTPLI